MNMAVKMTTVVFFTASLILITTGSTELVTHWLSRGSVQCYPVICHRGFQASFCKQDKTSDYCHSCPAGSTQHRIVDTRTLQFQEDVPKCSRIDIACLQPETIPVVEDGMIARCECDVSKGYIGIDPLCIKVNSCPRGEEIDKSNGRCLPCPKGTFKNTNGYDFCQPWTNCEILDRETLTVGNATEDTVCGNSLSTTTSDLNPTTTTVTMTLKCGTGNCLPTIYQTASKADVTDSMPHYQDMTYQTSEHCVTLIQMIALLITVTSALLIGVLIYRISFKRWGYLRFCHPRKKEKDIEICFKPGIQEVDEATKYNQEQKAGIQEVNETPKQKKRMEDVKKSTPIDDQEEPATFYPPINEQPVEPSAPEMSVGYLQPLIHVPPSCDHSKAEKMGLKVNVYVPKGNYD